VSLTSPSEASLARTINLAIDSDANQAAKAEQLFTPSPVARLRGKRRGVPRPPAMNIFRILGTVWNSLPRDEELIDPHRRPLPLDIDSDIVTQDDTNQRISPSQSNSYFSGMRPRSTHES
jgi:hypothetical protein